MAVFLSLAPVLLCLLLAAAVPSRAANPQALVVKHATGVSDLEAHASDQLAALSFDVSFVRDGSYVSGECNPYDVVFVSDFNEGGLGAVLAPCASPMVSSTRETDDLLLSSSRADSDNNNDDSLNVLLPSHPAVGGLSGTFTTHASKGSDRAWTVDWSDLAPGATATMSRPGDSSKVRSFVVESGGTLSDSSAAPNRRVHLPFEFDWSLTTNAELMLRAALGWAGRSLVEVSAPAGNSVEVDETFTLVARLESWQDVVFESDFSTEVLLELQGNDEGATLSGTLQVTVSAGAATLSGLSLDTPGTYTPYVSCVGARACQPVALSDLVVEDPISPLITSFVAAPAAFQPVTDNCDTGVTLTVTFDMDVTLAGVSVASKAGVDALFTFSRAIGNDYAAAASGTNAVVITVLEPLPGSPSPLDAPDLFVTANGNTAAAWVAGVVPPITDCRDTSPPLNGTCTPAAVSPSLVSATAAGAAGGADTHDDGDEMVLVFDRAVSPVEAGSRAALLRFLTFSPALGLRSNYAGAWEAGNTQLRVTWSVAVASAPLPEVGSTTVALHASGGSYVRNAAEDSLPGSGGAVVLGGSWADAGPAAPSAPSPVSLVADGGAAGANAPAYGAGDRVTLTFSEAVNTAAVPVATAADLAAFLSFRSPRSGDALAVSAAGAWASSTELVITVKRALPASAAPEVGVLVAVVDGTAAGLRNAASDSAPVVGESPPLNGSWGGPAGAGATPRVVELVAGGPDDADAELGAGDTVTLRFAGPVDAAAVPVATHVDLEALLAWESGVPPCAACAGAWSADADELVVTVEEPGAGPPPEVGGPLRVRLLAAAGLRSADGLSAAADGVQEPALSGSWGTRTDAAPAVLLVAAEDGDDGDAVYGAGDAVVLQFDTAMDAAGAPLASQSDIDAVLSFAPPVAAAMSASWRAGNTELVLTVDAPAPGDAPAVGGVTVTVTDAAAGGGGGEALRAAGGASRAVTGSFEVSAGSWGRLAPGVVAEHASGQGAFTGQRRGAAVAALRSDSDGDGRADLLEGFAGERLARVSLLRANATSDGVADAGPDIPASASLLNKELEAAGCPAGASGAWCAFGAAVAAVGDLDGDAVVDVAVGAPGQGAVYVLLMDAGGVARSHARLDDPDGAAGDGGFGSSLALLAPGVLAVGAPGNATADGRVCVAELAVDGTPAGSVSCVAAADALPLANVDAAGAAAATGTLFGAAVAPVPWAAAAAEATTAAVTGHALLVGAPGLRGGAGDVVWLELADARDAPVGAASLRTSGLVDPFPDAAGGFGSALSVCGDSGAPAGGDTCRDSGAGVVWVGEPGGSSRGRVWRLRVAPGGRVLSTEILPRPPAATDGDEWGSSVACLSGWRGALDPPRERVVVGAPNASAEAGELAAWELDKPATGRAAAASPERDCANAAAAAAAAASAWDAPELLLAARHWAVSADESTGLVRMRSVVEARFDPMAPGRAYGVRLALSLPPDAAALNASSVSARVGDTHSGEATATADASAGVAIATAGVLPGLACAGPDLRSCGGGADGTLRLEVEWDAQAGSAAGLAAGAVVSGTANVTWHLAPSDDHAAGAAKSAQVDVRAAAYGAAHWSWDGTSLSLERRDRRLPGLGNAPAWWSVGAGGKGAGEPLLVRVRAFALGGNASVALPEAGVSSPAAESSAILTAGEVERALAGAVYLSCADAHTVAEARAGSAAALAALAACYPADAAPAAEVTPLVYDAASGGYVDASAAGTVATAAESDMLVDADAEAAASLGLDSAQAGAAVPAAAAGVAGGEPARLASLPVVDAVAFGSGPAGSTDAAAAGNWTAELGCSLAGVVRFATLPGAADEVGCTLEWNATLGGWPAVTLNGTSGALLALAGPPLELGAALAGVGAALDVAGAYGDVRVTVTVRNAAGSAVASVTQIARIDNGVAVSGLDLDSPAQLTAGRGGPLFASTPAFSISDALEGTGAHVQVSVEAAAGALYLPSEVEGVLFTTQESSGALVYASGSALRVRNALAALVYVPPDGGARADAIAVSARRPGDAWPAPVPFSANVSRSPLSAAAPLLNVTELANGGSALLVGSAAGVVTARAGRPATVHGIVLEAPASVPVVELDEADTLVTVTASLRPPGAAEDGVGELLSLHSVSLGAARTALADGVTVHVSRAWIGADAAEVVVSVLDMAKPGSEGASELALPLSVLMPDGGAGGSATLTRGVSGDAALQLVAGHGETLALGALATVAGDEWNAAAPLELTIVAEAGEVRVGGDQGQAVAPPAAGDVWHVEQRASLSCAPSTGWAPLIACTGPPGALNAALAALVYRPPAVAAVALNDTVSVVLVAGGTESTVNATVNVAAAAAPPEVSFEYADITLDEEGGAAVPAVVSAPAFCAPALLTRNVTVDVSLEPAAGYGFSVHVVGTDLAAAETHNSSHASLSGPLSSVAAALGSGAATVNATASSNWLSANGARVVARARWQNATVSSHAWAEVRARPAASPLPGLNEALAAAPAYSDPAQAGVWALGDGSNTPADADAACLFGGPVYTVVWSASDGVAVAGDQSVARVLAGPDALGEWLATLEARAGGADAVVNVSVSSADGRASAPVSVAAVSAPLAPVVQLRARDGATKVLAGDGRAGTALALNATWWSSGDEAAAGCTNATLEITASGGHGACLRTGSNSELVSGNGTSRLVVRAPGGGGGGMASASLDVWLALACEGLGDGAAPVGATGFLPPSGNDPPSAFASSVKAGLPVTVSARALPCRAGAYGADGMEPGPEAAALHAGAELSSTELPSTLQLLVPADAPAVAVPAIAGAIAGAGQMFALASPSARRHLLLVVRGQLGTLVLDETGGVAEDTGGIVDRSLERHYRGGAAALAAALSGAGARYVAGDAVSASNAGGGDTVAAGVWDPDSAVWSNATAFVSFYATPPAAVLRGGTEVLGLNSSATCFGVAPATASHNVSVRLSVWPAGAFEVRVSGWPAGVAVSAPNSTTALTLAGPAATVDAALGSGIVSVAAAARDAAPQAVWRTADSLGVLRATVLGTGSAAVFVRVPWSTGGAAAVAPAAGGLLTVDAASGERVAIGRGLSSPLASVGFGALAEARVHLRAWAASGATVCGAATCATDLLLVARSPSEAEQALRALTYQSAAGWAGNDTVTVEARSEADNVTALASVIVRVEAPLAASLVVSLDAAAWRAPGVEVFGSAVTVPVTAYVASPALWNSTRASVVASARVPRSGCAGCDTDTAAPRVRLSFPGAPALPSALGTEEELVLSGNAGEVAAAAASGGLTVSLEAAEAAASRRVPYAVVRLEARGDGGAGTGASASEAVIVFGGAAAPEPALSLSLSWTAGRPQLGDGGAAIALLPRANLTWAGQGEDAARGDRLVRAVVSVLGANATVHAGPGPRSPAWPAAVSSPAGALSVTVVAPGEAVREWLLASELALIELDAGAEGNVSVAVAVSDVAGGAAAGVNASLVRPESLLPAMWYEPDAVPSAPVAAPSNGSAVALGIGAGVVGARGSGAAALNVTLVAAHGVVSAAGRSGPRVWFLSSSAAEAGLLLANATYAAVGGHTGLDDVVVRATGAGEGAAFHVPVEIILS